ncbi:MAG: hypothetical protein CMI16_14125 [Opitutaceae bacterium]|nr:hypothetical protein [Opitutaceae bacterium]
MLFSPGRHPAPEPTAGEGVVRNRDETVRDDQGEVIVNPQGLPDPAPPCQDQPAGQGDPPCAAPEEKDPGAKKQKLSLAQLKAARIVALDELRRLGLGDSAVHQNLWKRVRDLDASIEQREREAADKLHAEMRKAGVPATGEGGAYTPDDEQGYLQRKKQMEEQKKQQEDAVAIYEMRIRDGVGEEKQYGKRDIEDYKKQKRQLLAQQAREARRLKELEREQKAREAAEKLHAEMRNAGVPATGEGGAYTPDDEQGYLQRKKLLAQQAREKKEEDAQAKREGREAESEARRRERFNASYGEGASDEAYAQYLVEMQDAETNKAVVLQGIPKGTSSTFRNALWVVAQAEAKRSTYRALENVRKTRAKNHPEEGWAGWQAYLLTDEGRSRVLKETLKDLNGVLKAAATVDPEADGDEAMPGGDGGSVPMDEEVDPATEALRLRAQAMVQVLSDDLQPIVARIAQADDAQKDAADAARKEKRKQAKAKRIRLVKEKQLAKRLVREADAQKSRAKKADDALRKKLKDKWPKELVEEIAKITAAHLSAEPSSEDAEAHLKWVVDKDLPFRAEQTQRTSQSAAVAAAWERDAAGGGGAREKPVRVLSRLKAELGLLKTAAAGLEGNLLGIAETRRDELEFAVEVATLRVDSPSLEWKEATLEQLEFYVGAKRAQDKARDATPYGIDREKFLLDFDHEFRAGWDVRKDLDPGEAFGEGWEAVRTSEAYAIADRTQWHLKQQLKRLAEAVTNAKSRLGKYDDTADPEEQQRATDNLEDLERTKAEIDLLAGVLNGRLVQVMIANDEAHQARIEEKRQREEAIAKERRAAAAARATEVRQKTASENMEKRTRREAVRQQKYTEVFRDLTTGAAGASAKEAAVAVVVEQRRQSLQADYDKAIAADAKLPEREKDPETGAYLKDSSGNFVTRREFPEEHGANDAPKPKLRHPNGGFWHPVAVPLSKEQHVRLFRRPREIWPYDDASDTASVADSESMEVPGTSMEVSETSMDAPGTSMDPPTAPVPGKGPRAPRAPRATFDDPLLFDRGYALRLLEEHLEGLRLAHEGASPKAKFTNPAAALGVGAAEKLLPFFESMLRYRQVVLTAKRLIVKEEINFYSTTEDAKMEPELKQQQKKSADLERANEKAKQLASLELEEEDPALDKKAKEARRVEKAFVRSMSSRYAELLSRAAQLDYARDGRKEWDVEARRMISAHRGQLPGQLYSPQPLFLPLRISAPPRVGKSATALLVATLARRVGMLCTYSVAPNKKIPIQEMLQKISNLRWGPALPAGKVRNEGLSQPTLPFVACVVDDVPGEKKDGFGRWLHDPVRVNTRAVDMILYSNEEVTDCYRMGAYLGDLSEQPVAVANIRDEAQSYAKQLTNPLITGHRAAVPPNPELQYTRAYFGNLFGLNINVTATHFSTFLEEDMWGFIGSVGQNAHVPGLGVAADRSAISKQPGAKFLPNLVSALLPAVPAGYMGIDCLRPWKGRSLTSGPSMSAAEKLPKPQKPKKKAKGKPAPARPPSERRQPKRGETIEEPQSDEEEEVDWGDVDEEWVLETNHGEGDESESDAAKRRQAAKKDLETVNAHFLEWYRDGAQPMTHYDGTGDAVLVPMYVGALNARMADSAMASFVRSFSKLAHENPLKRRATKDDGVLFVFYTSVIKTVEKMKKSQINIGDDEPEKVGGDSATCFLYEPEENPGLKKGAFPKLTPFLASDAEAAIKYAHSRGITRVAALGYGMFKAGLTLQTEVETPRPGKKDLRNIYCPKYLAYTSLPEAPLDSMLQTVGRAFVELKDLEKPPGWCIEFLGRPGLVERLEGYNQMEERLAKVGGERVYAAIKVEFDRTTLVESETEGAGALGVVGSRRGDIAGILGMTRKRAVELQMERKKKAAKAAKKKAEEAKKKADAAREAAAAAKELEDAERDAEDTGGDEAVEEPQSEEGGSEDED